MVADAAAGGRLEEHSRVEDPIGVERRLDAAHQRQPSGWLQLQKVGALLGADAVLSGDRPAQSRRLRIDRTQEQPPLLAVGLEHREVNVAVTGMAAAGNQRSVSGSNLSDRGEEERELGSRHHRVHDVVRPGRLGGPRHAPTGTDQRLRGMPRKHVSVQRTPLHEHYSEAVHIGLEASLVILLEHHEQVGQGVSWTVDGMPRSSPA